MSDLQYLLDRQALQDLVAAYAHCVDSDDPGSAGALFADDGELCIFERGKEEPVRQRVGPAAIASAMAGLDRYHTTLHVVASQTVILDGDIAEGEAYCLAHHIHDVDGPEGTTLAYDYVMHIRYLDRYVRAFDGWRFARRHLVIEFTEDRPLSGP